MSTVPRDLMLRPVHWEDAYALWLWANEPEMRVAAFDRPHISWEQHTDWLNKQLWSTETRMWLACEVRGRPLGLIRFDTRDGWKTARLSYVLAPEARGVGYGRRLIEEGVALFRFETSQTVIGADVRSGNIPSLRIFRRLGWEETTGGNDQPRFLNTREEDGPPTVGPLYIVATSNATHVGLAHDLRAATGATVRLVTTQEELSSAARDVAKPRYVFFPHWSTLIPPAIWQAHECVVFHMTDLPYGRGGSPLQNLIVRGHRETVISAIKCEEELDAGPIYSQQPLSLEGSANEIFFRARAIIRNMILEIVRTAPVPEPQHGDIVQFRRRKPGDGDLRSADGPEKVYDSIRMLDAPGYPNAFLDEGPFSVAFTDARLVGESVRARAEFTFPSKPQ